MDCLICYPNRKVLYGQYMIQTNQKVSVIERITSSLYNKYAESQNYYFTKIINDLIMSQPTKATIQFKDLQQYNEDIEYCKKVYKLQSYPKKINILIEFYRFHKEIPRWAVNQQIIGVLNSYYNHKRKLEYYQIQQIVEMENKQNPNKTPKGIVGEKPQESSESDQKSSSQSKIIVGNVLDELNTEYNKRTITQQSDLIEIINNLNTQLIKKRLPTQLINNQQMILIKKDKMLKMKQIINSQKNQDNFNKNQKINFLTDNDKKFLYKLKKQSPIKSKHAQILIQLQQRVREKLQIKIKQSSKCITSNSQSKNIGIPLNEQNIKFKTQHYAQNLPINKQFKAKTFHNDACYRQNYTNLLIGNKHSTLHYAEQSKNQLLLKLNTLNQHNFV